MDVDAPLVSFTLALVLATWSLLSIGFVPALESLARLLPLTYAVSLLRGIWTGGTWWAHAGDVAALGIVFALATAVASRAFRWE